MARAANRATGGGGRGHTGCRSVVLCGRTEWASRGGTARGATAVSGDSTPQSTSRGLRAVRGHQAALARARALWAMVRCRGEPRSTSSILRSHLPGQKMVCYAMRFLWSRAPLERQVQLLWTRPTPLDILACRLATDCNGSRNRAREGTTIPGRTNEKRPPIHKREGRALSILGLGSLRSTAELLPLT